MNAILTADFKLPEDGVYHLAPEGEFLHKKTGLRQVLDAEACAAIVADFTTRAAEPGFPGVLVDYDHESLDMDKRTEAAGWLLSLEHRPGAGLWGRIRWTDTGDAAIRGGRYRFISPVWKQEDCEDLGEMRLRPRRLMNAAITNAPNMAGAAPLSNSCPAPSASPCGSSSPLANAIQPGNVAQRRAVFAKLHGAPVAAAAAVPMTLEQLQAKEDAAKTADERERQRRLELAKIIARRKAIEADQAKTKPYASAAAEAAKRGIQQAKVARPKPNAAAQPAPAGGRGGGGGRASPAKTAASLPLAYVRPTSDRLPGGRGLQWRRAPAQTQASRTTAALQSGQSIYDYFARNYANREPLTDEQRKAMWARMKSGDRAAGRAYIDDAFDQTTRDLKDLGVWGTLPGGGATSAKFLASGIKSAVPKIAAAARQIAPEVRQQIMALRERIAQWEEYAAPGAAEAIAKAKKTVGIMERQGVEQGVAESLASDIAAVRARAPSVSPKAARTGPYTFFPKWDAATATSRSPTLTEAKAVVRRWREDIAQYSRAVRQQKDKTAGAVPALYSNRGEPMSDEQRKAMFARMNYRGPTAVPAAPPPSSSLAALRLCVNLPWMLDVGRWMLDVESGSFLPALRLAVRRLSPPAPTPEARAARLARLLPR